MEGMEYLALCKENAQKVKCKVQRNDIHMISMPTNGIWCSFFGSVEEKSDRILRNGTEKVREIGTYRIWAWLR